ncbi:Hypp8791 [Branchiostoma lanceolatum]|uniref:Hypp8791 protein n=1 Tax=Branchiostoma lanceolatum TaxID=7740 RepID=A0A8J9ZA66_BRALA|nr:Hypp8791 [Branchiostoma lanceolatum]
MRGSRWPKGYGITVESERTSRNVAQSLLSEVKVKCDLLPFTVRLHDGASSVEAIPCASIPLDAAVLDHLTRSANRQKLTWHDGAIPADEVWIKVAGDHGGDLFKIGAQVLNKASPNSSGNTMIVCCFAAKDSRVNLVTGTAHINADIKSITERKWKSPDGRECSLRFFGASDYALLCQWFGNSGPCGTHPCLWCEVTRTSMAKPQAEREVEAPARSLQSLARDYREFIEHGRGQLSKAKNYRNVIAPAMFDIAIDQVCPPALHICLGIYQKIFKMIEADLHDLDVILASHLVKDILPDEDVDEAEVLHHHLLHGLSPYVLAVDEARQLLRDAEELWGEIDEMENELKWVILRAEGDSEDNFTQMVEAIASLQDKRKNMESKADTIIKKAKVTTTDGPLASRLEEALQKHHVRRQAYHSQSFVGNHVKIMLQKESIADLTSVASEAARDIVSKSNFPQTIITRTQAIEQRYKKLLSEFSECHKRFTHGSRMDTEQIDLLDESIRTFCASFREMFPTATFPIKMHILEQHVVPWVRRKTLPLVRCGCKYARYCSEACQEHDQERHRMECDVTNAASGLASNLKMAVAILCKMHHLPVERGQLSSIKNLMSREYLIMPMTVHTFHTTVTV